jgi:hypothetical protein
MVSQSLAHESAARKGAGQCSAIRIVVNWCRGTEASSQPPAGQPTHDGSERRIHIQARPGPIAGLLQSVDLTLLVTQAMVDEGTSALIVGFASNTGLTAY